MPTSTGHNQFENLYGQQAARLDRDQSIHGTIVNPRTMFVKTLSPFIFWGADDHLKALEKLWVDRMVHIDQWKQFINQLNEEWQEFIIVVSTTILRHVSSVRVRYHYRVRSF